MIQVQIDERQIDEIVQSELQKRLEKSTHRLTFWDMKELCKQTNMSEKSGNQEKRGEPSDRIHQKYQRLRSTYFYHVGAVVLNRNGRDEVHNH